jgi:hypothetical protein
LIFSANQNRILITFNRKHFIRLHAENSDHAGIIVCTVDANFEALAQHINTALAENETMTGQLIRVNRLPEK